MSSDEKPKTCISPAGILKFCEPHYMSIPCYKCKEGIFRIDVHRHDYTVKKQIYWVCGLCEFENKLILQPAKIFKVKRI